MRITFDTNCLISLESPDDQTEAVRQIVEMQQQDRVRIQVPAVVASERQMDGSYLRTISDFEKRLARLGLEAASLLLPLGYWDVHFWNWSIYADEAMAEKEQQIRNVLFPGQDSPDLSRKNRNALCDVQCMWCHLHYGGEVFVTNDSNFHKASKKRRLLAMGAGQVLRPREARDFINQSLATD
jgi:predicted nucleic acid-binding protein